jgi:hypothetical protein
MFDVIAAHAESGVDGITLAFVAAGPCALRMARAMGIEPVCVAT